MRGHFEDNKFLNGEKSGRIGSNLAHRLVDWAAARPVLFDSLRWILEFGYAGERGVLRREGILAGQKEIERRHKEEKEL